MAANERLTSRDAAALEFLEPAQQRVWPTMQEKRAVQLIRKRASANTACLSRKNRLGGVQAERARVCTAQIRALTKRKTKGRTRPPGNSQRAAFSGNGWLRELQRASGGFYLCATSPNPAQHFSQLLLHALMNVLWAGWVGSQKSSPPQPWPTARLVNNLS